jgi:hypothetical protein
VSFHNNNEPDEHASANAPTRIQRDRLVNLLLGLREQVWLGIFDLLECR